MVYEHTSATEYLRAEFEKRVAKNPRYSLRAFARALQVNAAEISQVFRGQRRLSWASAQKIAAALGHTVEESRHFYMLLQSDKTKQIGLELDFHEQPPDQLSLDAFAKIGDWYHFAILNLLDTKEFRWNASHIAKRLGITVSEAILAMRNLEQCGMVSLTTKAGRKPESPKAHWEVSSRLPSTTIRRYHRQCLEKAIEALDQVPMQLREYRGSGLVIHAEDLAQIRTELDRFTKHLQQRYHRAGKSQVYQVQIAVFPLTKESS